MRLRLGFSKMVVALRLVMVASLAASVTGPLCAQRAEELWQAASSEEQRAIRRLFGRLVTVGEGKDDTAGQPREQSAT